MARTRLIRTTGVLLACLGLAATSLAAKSGSAPTDPAAAVVTAARAELGDGYRWGGAGPDAWDCSGLVYTLWRGVGGVADVPRVSRDQQAWARPLPVEQVVPGDLVFFGDPVTHVGIVTSHSGTAVRMIDAASSQKGVVERAVWTTGVIRYGRVPRPRMLPIQPWTPPPAPAPAAVTAPLTLPAAAQRVASTPLALAAVTWARKAVGRTDLSDAGLVDLAWKQAGGPTLPTTRTALLARTTGVAFADARAGDLISYAAPAAHLGIYIGQGLMIDASRRLGKVVLRPVWGSPGLTVVRLAG